MGAWPTWATEKLPVPVLDALAGLIGRNAVLALVGGAGVVVPKERGQWRHIDSAPKDGRPIFLLSATHEMPSDEDPSKTVTHLPRVHIGRWDPNGTSWVDEHGSLCGEPYELAVTGIWESGGGWFEPNEVTHWMNIPEPDPNNPDPFRDYEVDDSQAKSGEAA